MSTRTIQSGHRYAIEYRTRELGYGIEEGSGDYVAIDETNLGGGRGFEPVDGGETIYLFDDEIVSIDESEGLSIDQLDFAGQRLVAAHDTLAGLIFTLVRYEMADDEVQGALDTVREIGEGLRGI